MGKFRKTCEKLGKKDYVVLGLIGAIICWFPVRMFLGPDVAEGLFLFCFWGAVWGVIALIIRISYNSHRCPKCGSGWAQLNKTGRTDEEEGEEFECRRCGLLWLHLIWTEGAGIELTDGTVGPKPTISAGTEAKGAISVTPPRSQRELAIWTSLVICFGLVVYYIAVSPAVDVLVTGKFVQPGDHAHGIPYKVYTPEGTPFAYWGIVTSALSWSLLWGGGVVLSAKWLLRQFRRKSDAPSNTTSSPSETGGAGPSSFSPLPANSAVRPQVIRGACGACGRIAKLLSPTRNRLVPICRLCWIRHLLGF